VKKEEENKGTVGASKRRRKKGKKGKEKKKLTLLTHFHDSSKVLNHKAHLHVKGAFNELALVNV
jgi:hypothetical protein